MGNINDRETRKHQEVGLEKALVYERRVAVAPQPFGARVQRHKCHDVASALRERGVQDSALLHVRLRATAQQARQGRRGVAACIGTAGREIVPRDADHVHLHPQGDERENQVR